LKIVFFISGWDGCGYYRVQVVAKYLNKIKGVQVKISQTICKSEIQWADIIIFQKPVNKDALPYLEYAKVSGKKICVEVDDDYFSLEPHNPAYQFFQDKKDVLIKFYQTADAITVTTEHLREVLLKYNPNIDVLPNSLDFPLLDEINKLSDKELYKYTKYLDKDKQFISLDDALALQKDKIVIGWSGSPTHLRDLEQVTGALIQICKRNKDVLVVMGACTTNEILDNLSKEQMLLVEPVPIYKYHHLLASMKWDIGVCPIEDSEFNKSKSNLKFVEFSVNKYACVCSAVENYRKAVIPLENGLLANNTTDSWVDKLTQLIRNEELRKTISENAYNYVRENFNIVKNVNLWLDCYKKILGEL